MNKEPAIIIGTIATILVGIIGTLAGNGFISDVSAGKAVDIVQATEQLLILLAPLLAAVATRSQVFSPATMARLMNAKVATTIKA